MEFVTNRKLEANTEGNKLLGCQVAIFVSAIALFWIIASTTQLNGLADLGIALGYGLITLGIIHIAYNKKSQEKIKKALASCMSPISNFFSRCYQAIKSKPNASL